MYVSETTTLSRNMKRVFLQLVIDVVTQKIVLFNLILLERVAGNTRKTNTVISIDQEAFLLLSGFEYECIRTIFRCGLDCDLTDITWHASRK